MNHKKITIMALLREGKITLQQATTLFRDFRLGDFPLEKTAHGDVYMTCFKGGGTKR